MCLVVSRTKLSSPRTAPVGPPLECPTVDFVDHILNRSLLKKNNILRAVDPRGVFQVKTKNFVKKKTLRNNTGFKYLTVWTMGTSFLLCSS